jgi:hypothetical protein
MEYPECFQVCLLVVEADEVITDFANVYFVVFDEGEDLAVAWRICEFDGVLRLV